ncbi:MAG: TrbI/VirB10 family protein [Succinivibrio sp.]|nr:TrbI/VirB10 family protein [Succinivibrio sp.]
MDNEKKKFQLTPMQKKMLAIGGLAGVAFIFLQMIGANNNMKKEREPIVNVLTDRSSKELGMESLITQIKMANDKLLSQAAENNKLRKEFEDVKKILVDSKISTRTNAQIQAQLEDLTQQLQTQKEKYNKDMKQLKQENENLYKIANGSPTVNIPRTADGTMDVSKLDEKVGNTPSGKAGNGKNGGNNVRGQGSNPHDVREIQRLEAELKKAKEEAEEAKKSFLDRKVNVTDPNKLYAQNYAPTQNYGDVALDADGNPTSQDSSIKVIGGDDSAAQQLLEQMAAAQQKPSVYLPVGTMVKGVLLSGLYAPTGVNARKDPFPVILRIQDEAIMPNLKKADLKECFLTLSGYGDLSSERALMRGETLSCIANDNSVIETKFPSYAVGEDGKAGIGGRLITRNGKALRNAMLSGFFSGMSDAFETTKVQKLDISGSSSDTYENAMSSENLNNGLFNGASDALGKLADYYMSMAEQTFPVIEIDAGREITVTLTQGTDLTTVRESPEQQQINAQQAVNSASNLDMTPQQIMNATLPGHPSNLK